MARWGGRSSPLGRPQTAKPYRVLDGNPDAPTGFGFYVGTSRTPAKSWCEARLGFDGSPWAASPTSAPNEPNLMLQS